MNTFQKMWGEKLFSNVVFVINSGLIIGKVLKKKEKILSKAFMASFVCFFVFLPSKIDKNWSKKLYFDFLTLNFYK